jgi:hypothetical protein
MFGTQVRYNRFHTGLKTSTFSARQDDGHAPEREANTVYIKQFGILMNRTTLQSLEKPDLALIQKHFIVLSSFTISYPHFQPQNGLQLEFQTPDASR